MLATANHTRYLYHVPLSSGPTLQKSISRLQRPLQYLIGPGPEKPCACVLLSLRGGATGQGIH